MDTGCRDSVGGWYCVGQSDSVGGAWMMDVRVDILCEGQHVVMNDVEIML